MDRLPAPVVPASTVHGKQARGTAPSGATSGGKWYRMAVRNVAHPSVDDRRATGGQARERTPPSGHAGWIPAADRPDPVALLEEQNLTREKDLVPVRHGRMMVSPFRNNGFSKGDTRQATTASVRAYREAMASFAKTRTMDIWYAHLGAGPRPVWGPYQQFVTAIRSGRLEALEGV